LFVVVLHAQQDEGVIFFESRLDVHRILTGNDTCLRSLIPEYQIFHSKLFFKKGESLYRSKKQSGGSKILPVNRTEAVTYTNFTTGRRYRQIEKKYQIEEEICAPGWILSDETQTILGYSCRLAVLHDVVLYGNPMILKAWFTGELPHGMGPMLYGQLPGTILKLDLDEGTNIYTATEIKFRKVKKKEMKPPGEGKKMTLEEYNAMFR